MKKVSIKPNTYIYLTILLLTIPFPWVVAWLAAITTHELFHYFAVKLCGGKIHSIAIGFGGAELQCSQLTQGCSIFAVMCGPIGGFLLAGLGRYFPRTALCSFLLSVYNLLPIMPFDGGRVLQLLITSKRVFCFVKNITIMIILLISIYATLFFNLGIFPLLLVLGIYIKNRKSPCKEGICRVQ